MRDKFCKYIIVSIKKYILFSILTVLLNSCVQSTAMVGPAYTFVSTGNIFQTGFTFGANKMVEKETGLSTSKIISNKLNKDKNKKKNDNNIDESLLILVDLNIKKTREIIKNDQSISLNYNNTN